MNPWNRLKVHAYVKLLFVPAVGHTKVPGFYTFDFRPGEVRRFIKMNLAWLRGGSYYNISQP